MNSHQILDHFNSRLEAMARSIREIVDIESPSHDRERSRLVADWVEEQARTSVNEINVERISVDDGDHLIIKAFPGNGRPVMLLGHTDTVHAVGSRAHNPTRIDGDKFYGCGIFDMKANIAVLLEVLRYFTETGTRPQRPIKILLSCDEEVGSHTGRPIVEREAAGADACLVLEPSADGRVKTGRKGTGVYTLRAHGSPAHAGLEPEKGANAIAELAIHIPELHSLNNSSAGTTVNVTTFRGGSTTNVIPEFAECEIDVRFGSSSEAERVDAAVRGLRPVDERVSLEVSGGINRPPMERSQEVIALYQKARGLAASFGYELGETQVGGASDGNFVAALGVPVIDGLGVTGAGAHMLSEHILVSDIAKRAALITLLLQQGLDNDEGHPKTRS